MHLNLNPPQAEACYFSFVVLFWGGGEASLQHLPVMLLVSVVFSADFNEELVFACSFWNNGYASRPVRCPLQTESHFDGRRAWKWRCCKAPRYQPIHNLWAAKPVGDTPQIKVTIELSEKWTIARRISPSTWPLTKMGEAISLLKCPIWLWYTVKVPFFCHSASCNIHVFASL